MSRLSKNQKSQSNGSEIGLGLTNAKIICKALGGKILVKKNCVDQQGTEIIFKVRIDPEFYQAQVNLRRNESWDFVQSEQRRWGSRLN